MGLHAQEERAEACEGVFGQCLREDVRGHVVGGAVADVDDVALIEVAHVGDPPLEVFGG